MDWNEFKVFPNLQFISIHVSKIIDLNSKKRVYVYIWEYPISFYRTIMAPKKEKYDM
jgi:hypothetical protein